MFCAADADARLKGVGVGGKFCDKINASLSQLRFRKAGKGPLPVKNGSPGGDALS